eukprot:754882_1
MTTSHTYYNYDGEPDSVSIEEPLCNYLAAFDGTRRDFDDVRRNFDNLFSDDLVHMMDGLHTIDKPDVARIHERLMDRRVVATLEGIHFVDDMRFEYTVHWRDDRVSMVAHIIAVVEDGKIVEMRPCKETVDVFASMRCA